MESKLNFSLVKTVYNVYLLSFGALCGGVYTFQREITSLGVIMLSSRDIDYIIKTPVPGMRNFLLSIGRGSPRDPQNITEYRNYP